MSQEDSIRPAEADGHGPYVRNTAHHSSVGVQAGSVRGSTVLVHAVPGTTRRPVDLITELRQLGEDLRRHHAEGDLDDDTYREAMAELTSARRAAEENTPESPKRATLALKRLRCLIADVPVLLTALAPLVAAAGEL